MRRALAVVIASGLVAALPGGAGAAKSCKPKREAVGCVIKSAEWGVINGFQRSANVSVSGRELHQVITMKPGTASGNYPTAPKTCAVIMSTRGATAFGSGPRIKGAIRVGRTYSGTSSFKIARGDPGFRDPGANFGSETSVQSMEATYRLTVKIVSAGRVKVTASGTNTANVTYRDPSSPDNDPKYVPGRFTCSGSYSGTIKRGNY